jgi:drug/metabolite transporter (DMT)-like permease
MTYPLFVAFIAWAFLPEQREYSALIALLAAFAGVLLILYPKDVVLNRMHLC